MTPDATQARKALRAPDGATCGDCDDLLLTNSSPYGGMYRRGWCMVHKRWLCAWHAVHTCPACPDWREVQPWTPRRINRDT